MANQKIWNRNYDNLFCDVYASVNHDESTTSSPNHNKIWYRTPDGTYRTSETNEYYYKRFIALLSCALSIPTINTYISNYSLNSFYDGDPDEYLYGIQIGTGTGEATKEDYKLFTPLLSNCKIGAEAVLSSNYDATTHSYSRVIKVPINYTGANAVNVSEFGIFAPIPKRNTGITAISSTPILIYHEVFDEPITLEQNDTIEITLTQTIQQPNYSEYPITE